MATIINNPRHPVILFIPEVGIYPYARGLAFLGNAVTQNGGVVYITHDTGQMIRTPMMSMHKMPPEISSAGKEKIYTITEKYYKNIRKKLYL